MKEVWYIAVEKFDPSHKAWENYIQWSGLNQLDEVVGLDTILCSSVVSEILPEDWDFIVNEDYLLSFFRDRRYLTERTKDIDGKQLLAVILEPQTEQRHHPMQDAEFMGYDLVERQTGISALTNCGGFPESFKHDELNTCGLLSDYARARQVQRALRENNPYNDHADTDLWAIWRLQSGA